jgi:hypothetical protein
VLCTTVKFYYEKLLWVTYIHNNGIKRMLLTHHAFVNGAITYKYYIISQASDFCSCPGCVLVTVLRIDSIS